jgi:uncharacterized protein YjiS (DUF1127 family)
MGNLYVSIVQGKGGIHSDPQQVRRFNECPPWANLEKAMPAITALAIAAAGQSGHAARVLGGLAIRGLKQVSSRMRHRREAMRLAALDDRMLADIGLTRFDLRDAYSEPLWHDPTDVLARRAAERRTSLRRSPQASRPAQCPM